MVEYRINKLLMARSNTYTHGLYQWTEINSLHYTGDARDFHFDKYEFRLNGKVFTEDNEEFEAELQKVRMWHTLSFTTIYPPIS